MRESNHIDRKNVNEMFVKTLRKDSDSVNSRVFIGNIDDDYMPQAQNSNSEVKNEDHMQNN